MLQNLRRWSAAIGLGAVLAGAFLLTGPYGHTHSAPPSPAIGSLGGHGVAPSIRQVAHDASRGVAPAIAHAAQVANRPLTQQPAAASTPTPVPTSFPALKCTIIADSAGFANCVVSSPNTAYTVLVVPDAAGAYANYIGWTLTITLTYP